MSTRSKNTDKGTWWKGVGLEHFVVGTPWKECEKQAEGSQGAVALATIKAPKQPTPSSKIEATQEDNKGSALDFPQLTLEGSPPSTTSLPQG